MFDFSSSVFGSKISIPPSTKVIFVADMFVDDYVGGAELTTEALIKSSPFEVFKLKSKDVTLELLKEGSDKFWIFGNFAELNSQLIPSIIGNLRYSIVEYDYKYCRARSPEKHFHMTGMPCDCTNQMNGKLISAFFYGAAGLWWMSEAQKNRYHTAFPFLAEKDNIVLSSVFDAATLGAIKHFRTVGPDIPRHGWIVLGSKSWIKGADDAEKWCKDNGKDYEVVWNVPYHQLLQKLSTAEGFVYLPKGGDTCPRMVIEAKLLGCKLQLNDNVQHKNEDWFATDDLQSIQDYLFAAPGIFWNGVKNMMEYRPTISGYTTTYNCVKQQYPFEQCIESMLQFCDEVCVVDGGSDDGTYEALLKIAAEHVTQDPMTKEPNMKLKVKQVKRDWSSKRHPVFDGMQKAEARAMCTKEFCWQMDSDEVVHEDDCQRIFDLCRATPRAIEIVALPVIEYWGGVDKVRMDIQPWKWRLSRNLPHITHGIPKELRRYDSNGELYASEGTDGCDMISSKTFERLPFVNFYQTDVDVQRRAGLAGNEHARKAYESWFNQVVNNLPSVFHYSWLNLPRKIKLYRDYWQNHWAALWDRSIDDTAENNMFFDTPWSQVTDEMIEQRANELKSIGGWIWHRKWDGTRTPWITVQRSEPTNMR